GPRYLYEASSALIALTSVSISRMPAFFRKRMQVRLPLTAWRGLISAMLIVLTLIAFGSTDYTLFKKYGHNYRAGNPDYVQWAMDSVEKPAVILMQNDMEFTRTVFLMPQDDNAPVIFAHDMGDQNTMIMTYYAQRHVYLLRHKKLTQLR